MERKIGEIFECNGEWYQCVKSDGTCNGCVGKFQPYSFCNGFKECVGKIFKKLEKVGEPYTTCVDKTVQNYLLETAVSVPPKDVISLINNEQRLIAIEIKQNKEDMEEQHSTENYPTKEEKIAERIANKIANKVREDIQNQIEKNMNKLKLKPFSLEAAKAGKPVCTRDGRKARIICFDLKNEEYPIVAAIGNDSSETLLCYTINGEIVKGNYKSDKDLMMLPEKKEGWIIKPKDYQVYQSKTDAEEVCNKIIKLLQRLLGRNRLCGLQETKMVNCSSGG